MQHLEQVEEQEDTQHGRFLTFNLDDEVYGIEIRFVTEIIGLQPFTRLPEVPDYIKGIINLRGRIIPVVDMRLKFNKEPVAYDERTCIVIVEIQELTAGLIVDSVSEVVAIADENIIPPPDIEAGSHVRYIKGIGKVGDAIKMLLDCEILFHENESQNLIGINK